MTKQNRNTRSLGTAGAAAFLLLLAASSALAISAVGERPGPGPGQRQRALRESQIRVMDIFARNYGDTDWSLVLSDLDAHPEDPSNPAFMSIPLSLANVYLNRYEAHWDKGYLERSLDIFEWVAGHRELWGGREGTGSVVSYLDIGVARLRAECDVGGFESRIDELWQTAMKITAEEAGALLETVGVPGQPCARTLRQEACLQSILPFPEESAALASRAALFAAASSFLAEDPRAGAWAENARSFAARIPTSVCQSADTQVTLSQGELASYLGGGEGFDADPRRGRRIGRTVVRCAAFSTVYETPGPVDVVSPGESLALAIRDSQVVAYSLSNYLWRFPPGSQCEVADEGDSAGGSRF
jgi:hypothetical protein